MKVWLVLGYRASFMKLLWKQTKKKQQQQPQHRTLVRIRHLWHLTDFDSSLRWTFMHDVVVFQKSSESSRRNAEWNFPTSNFITGSQRDDKTAPQGRNWRIAAQINSHRPIAPLCGLLHSCSSCTTSDTFKHFIKTTNSQHSLDIKWLKIYFVG